MSGLKASPPFPAPPLPLLTSSLLPLSCLLAPLSLPLLPPPFSPHPQEACSSCRHAGAPQPSPQPVTCHGSSLLARHPFSQAAGETPQGWAPAGVGVKVRRWPSRWGGPGCTLGSLPGLLLGGVCTCFRDKSTCDFSKYEMRTDFVASLCPMSPNDVLTGAFNSVFYATGMPRAQAVTSGAWRGALGETPLPPCSRLFLRQTMFSMCLRLYPYTLW